MAWGKQPQGVSDLVSRLNNNSEPLKSLIILRFRRLNDEDVLQLSEALASNTALQELICSSHPISVTAAAALGHMLKINSTLQRISIGNSTFGDQALAAMVEAGLHANKGLCCLDLEHKGLTQACAASVSRVLQQHPRLQQLTLSRNTLTDQGMQQLCSVPWPAALSHLELAQCSLTHQGVAALASACSVRQLQQLDLSSNSLGPDAAGALRSLLETANQLQQLQLKDTKLGDKGVAGLAAALPGSDALADLDLSNTGLGAESAAALAAALAAPPPAAAASLSAAGARLQRLVLAGNRAVSDEAVAQLGAALAAARAGRAEQQGLFLDLALSGVGAAGLKALSTVPDLTRLSVFGCRLQAAAFDALIGCLRNGRFGALQQLDLTGCGLQLEQLQRLMQLLAGCAAALPRLHTLEIGANEGVSEEGFEEGVAALRPARPGLDVHFRMADSDQAPQQQQQ